MNETVTRRNRLVLVTIAVLFFLPLLMAVLMQSKWWQYAPDGTTNLGELVDPPVAIQASVTEGEAGADLAGRWQMAYLLDGDCGRACQDAVTGLRQAHTATGRHQDGVSVALYASGGLPDDQRALLSGISEKFVLVEDPWGRAANAFHTAATQVWPNGGGATGSVFLIDPQGHIILAYEPGTDPNAIYKDLKKLLKWSSQE